MKSKWKIVTQYILDHEDEFMEYLESEHEIEGSDMDFILETIGSKIQANAVPVITKTEKRKGENGRTKKHYLVGDTWFDLNSLALTIPANAYGDLLSAQALNGRIVTAENPLNNPDILAPRLTNAERMLATIAAKASAAASRNESTDEAGRERRAKLMAIPVGVYDNI